MAEWFIKRGDLDLGPLSVAQLERMVARGKLYPDDLVKKDDGTFKPASQYSGLIPDEYDEDEFDDYDDDDRDARRRNRRRQLNDRPRRDVNVTTMTLWPAIAFYGLTVGWLVYVGVQLFRLRMMPEGIVLDDQVTSFLRKSGNIVLGVVIFGNIMVLLGAVCLQIRRFYGLAMTGAIISLIPALSPACCLGMPVGLWAIMVMCNPDVRDSFH